MSEKITFREAAEILRRPVGIVTGELDRMAAKFLERVPPEDREKLEQALMLEIDLVIAELQLEVEEQICRLADGADPEDDSAQLS